MKRKAARPVVKGETQTAPLSIADIKELFTLMRENDIAELEFDQADSRVHIVSKGAHNVAPPQLVSVMTPVGPVQPQLVTGIAEAATAPAEVSSASVKAPPETPSNLKTVYSPMVGTFYRAASPENPSFVSEGDVVNEESVLCIIEAMKLMNEIKAETKGKIVRILVENGMPVEYNQPLFLLEP